MDQTEASYGFRTTIAVPLDEAIVRTKAALQHEGFGVLTTIDILRPAVQVSLCR
jgi:uncharacterized protein (DUF302 family)